MTTVERTEDAVARDIAVTIVDTDVHPLPVSGAVLKSYAPPEWKDREKYPETFVIDELRCIYCGMCEQACPVDAIELTTLFDLTGLSREEMMFDKEKLLSVFDETVKAGTDPVRTEHGRLGPASELVKDNPLAGSTTAQP